MQADDYQKLIAQLQTIIQDTVKTLDAFEEQGMNEHMQLEYEKLHAILHKATSDQREYQHALLQRIREETNKHSQILANK